SRSRASAKSFSKVMGARRFGLMLFARFGGIAGLPAAFGFRRRKGRLQIFDPGARIGEGLLLFGRRSRQPRVLARRAIQFFLQPVARHPQLVLLAFGELGSALRGRRKFLFQSFDALAGVAQRAVPFGELLRKKPIFAGEAVSSFLKRLRASRDWQLRRSRYGRLRDLSRRRYRPPRSGRRRARWRLVVLASDVGGGLVELARQSGLDAQGDWIRPGFRNQPQSLAPAEQGPAPIDGRLRARAKRGVRRDEAVKPDTPIRSACPFRPLP